MAWLMWAGGAFALTLGVIPESAALAGPHLRQTNLIGATTYAAPPAGFDALDASDGDLADFGFPPRPTSFGDGRQIRSWQRIVQAAHHRIEPILQQTGRAAGPPRGLVRRSGERHTANGFGDVLHANAAAFYYSKNWAAEVVQTQHITGFGPGAFTSALAWFDVPIASQPFGTCTGGWDQLFTWVGIDGWTANQVFQAGTASDAFCGLGTTSQNYLAWYEWYPNLAVAITNLTISPGDVVGIWLIADSGTAGHAFVVNGTTNNYAIVGWTAPAGIALRGDSVEWVQERPSNAAGVLQPLTNFFLAWMSEEAAWQYGSNVAYSPGYVPYGANLLFVTMLDDAGKPDADMYPLGGNATEFQTTGSAR